MGLAGEQQLARNRPGNSRSEALPGSILHPRAGPARRAPPADPAHTRKGIRKPGQYGDARITVRNLKVVRVDPTNNLLLVRGAVPGHNGGFLIVRQTNKV